MQKSPQHSAKHSNIEAQKTTQMNNHDSSGYVVPAGIMPEQPKKSHKKAAIITVSVIVGILALVYAIGAFFFSSHFFPNTTFSGHDVSFESNDSFASAKLWVKGFFEFLLPNRLI